MTLQRQDVGSDALGFKSGARGAHTSRTMMLAELQVALDALPPATTLADYRRAALEENLFGKRTTSTRRQTVQRLAEMYGLDPSVPLFRVLRQLWDAAEPGRPMLALLCATARDPLLRGTAAPVLAARTGEEVPTSLLDSALEAVTAGRLNAAIRNKVARNAASSWTQAGLLSGHARKVRSQAVVTPVVVAYALLLGYFAGRRGRALLATFWVRLLGRSEEDLLRLAGEASRQGWMDMQRAGDVIEIRFPELVTAAEEKLSHERA